MLRYVFEWSLPHQGSICMHLCRWHCMTTRAWTTRLIPILNGWARVKRRSVYLCFGDIAVPFLSGCPMFCLLCTVCMFCCYVWPQGEENVWTVRIQAPRCVCRPLLHLAWITLLPKSHFFCCLFFSYGLLFLWFNNIVIVDDPLMLLGTCRTIYCLHHYKTTVYATFRAYVIVHMFVTWRLMW